MRIYAGLVSELSKPRVLVVGGGVAGLETAFALRALVGSSIEIEVIAPVLEFKYLPYSVFRSFNVDIQDTLELPTLLAQKNILFRQGALERVDSDAIVTVAGERIGYDFLVLAYGTRALEWLPGALTFAGREGPSSYRSLLQDLESGTVNKVAYVLTGTSTWPLPLYELLLQTDSYLRERGVSDYRLELVTNESAPLSIFGNRASNLLTNLLARHGVSTHTSRYASRLTDGYLELTSSDRIPVDRVVTLPKLVGRKIEGISSDEEGFLHIDLHGSLKGYEKIYAAGDCTDFPVKQGGIASQQADAVAESIAAADGVALEPAPFHPVLRGMLFAEGQPRYMCSDLGGGDGEAEVSTTQPLWWPPTKITGKYLAPFLASYAGLGFPPAPRDGISVTVELDGNVKAPSY